MVPTDEDRSRLLEFARQVWGGTLAVVPADHVTVRYGPRPALDPAERRALGAACNVVVTHAGPPDRRIQAVQAAVDLSSHGLRVYNERPHITVSHAPEVAAVFSNAFLEQNQDRLQSVSPPLVLRARFGAYVEWPDGSSGVCTDKDCGDP